MGKSDKKQQPLKVDMSQPDSLRELDKETLIGIIVRFYEQNRQLSELFQAYIQEKYGPKSERFVDPNQLRLFAQNEEGEPENATTEPDNDSEQAQSERPEKKSTTRQRNPRPSNLPHVRVPAKKWAPEELICQCCGKPLVKVNEVIVHSRYNYKPSSICIEDIVEDVYACAECQEALVSASEAVGLIQGDELAVEATSEASIESPTEWSNMPGVVTLTQTEVTASDDSIETAVTNTVSTMRQAAARIAKCEASAGMLSYLAVSKYCDHLPLYRMEQIFARLGANISRSTMCGWLAALADLLRGIYDLMHKKLLESKVIKTDDTPVKVLDRKFKKKIKIGRMWVYIGDKDHPFILFHYTPGRSRAGPKSFLRGFKQYLQGDCFSGNEAICAENGATLVACNAHARRYFKKALLNYKSKSQEALRFFQQLFDIERAAKELELSAADIKLMREQEAKPILDSFKTWLDTEHVMALPKSAFGKAVSYCLNNWDALTAYLHDGDLSIDNNLAEQQMKRIAMGRKAWLFLGSDDGGERAEVLLSIIATCKLHGVEPWAYLRDVIETLTANPEADLEPMLPNNWRPKSVQVTAVPPAARVA